MNAISSIEGLISPLRRLGSCEQATCGLRHGPGFAAAPRLFAHAAAVLAVFCIHTGFAAEPADELKIIPPQPILSGPHATQQLVVEELCGGQFAGDVTAKAKFTSS